MSSRLRAGSAPRFNKKPPSAIQGPSNKLTAQGINEIVLSECSAGGCHYSGTTAAP